MASTVNIYTNSMVFHMYRIMALISGRGVTHFVLFDCSKSFAATCKELRVPERFATEGEIINSPIIAAFKTAIVDSDKIRVHIVPSPPIGVKDILQSLMNVVANCFGIKRKTSAFQFLDRKPHLVKQLRDGYKYLADNYIIDSLNQARDRVSFFGDGEGAFVANALAEIIRKTATQTKFMRVELLGMWHDPDAPAHQHKLCSLLDWSGANASLTPVGGSNSFVVPAAKSIPTHSAARFSTCLVCCDQRNVIHITKSTALDSGRKGRVHDHVRECEKNAGLGLKLIM
ncbi:uncharacterized protein FOMMEDRAFT_31021 [Fomitiporia mediterranea MF3/22]|uniref:uncharacterized protein n=1 Tax=Fomitiporia mediterranea (strain MF3/22) TaxID=694068 RepID=UPI0004407E25|nr:uncharacterized protein FOMMEDRAFT_31021 [Fomitiporia mediterranea MF3/22]EJC99737.1 hypothetical protein FOMMEDRAFT_31021 [Fomitiporia mediterranea MF3/22]